MDTAWKLQGERERRERTEAELREKAKAGAELGLDPALLAEAEAMVRMESEGRALRRAQSRRALLSGLAAGVVALGLITGGVLLVRGAPAAPPIVAPFDASWRMETSPGSVAHVTYDGGVALIQVEQFTAQPDGRFWANLESDAYPNWQGLQNVTFSVRGDLPNVRLYLENPTERWRGPVIPVTSDWTTHTLPLASFEHQVKDGGWSVTVDQMPSTIKTMSFKTGWYVNEPSAHGTVALRDLHAE